MINWYLVIYGISLSFVVIHKLDFRPFLSSIAGIVIGMGLIWDVWKKNIKFIIGKLYRKVK